MKRKPRTADSDTNTDFSVTYHYPLQGIQASIKAQNSNFISLRPFFYYSNLAGICTWDDQVNGWWVGQ